MEEERGSEPSHTPEVREEEPGAGDGGGNGTFPSRREEVIGGCDGAETGAGAGDDDGDAKDVRGCGSTSYGGGAVGGNPMMK